jgi:ADP-ribose pyrophosphatase
LAEEKTISSKYAFKGQVLNLRIDTVITADGSQSTREIIEHAECVVIVPVDNNGDILLVKQFRKAIEKDLLELPAGGIEPGEKPLAAVKRELQEEVGYKPGKTVKLGGYYSSPGCCTEFMYLYLATELIESKLQAEDTDGIEIVRIKPRQVSKLISSGEICDAKSVAGLLQYLDYKKKNSK